jgi:transcriptional regulator with XRE-family HTH domain
MYFIGKGDINQVSNLIFSISYLKLGISNLIILLSNLIIFKKGNKKMPYLEKFKAARDEKKISNATIAMLSNTSLPTVTRFFQGNGKRLSVDTVASIATILDVSLDEAFGIGTPTPVQKPLDPNVEAVITSYTELLKEKDERIKEQTDRLLEMDETIKNLRVDKVKMQKKVSMIVTLTLTLTLIFVAAVLFFLLFDLMNGHFGYFRY